jgi:hypothetical protein
MIKGCPLGVGGVIGLSLLVFNSIGLPEKILPKPTPITFFVFFSAKNAKT